MAESRGFENERNSNNNSLVTFALDLKHYLEFKEATVTVDGAIERPKIQFRL